MRGCYFLSFTVALCLSLALANAEVKPGNSCRLPNGKRGTCRQFKHCASAKNDWHKYHVKPKYYCNSRLLCCTSSKAKTIKPGPKRPIVTTTARTRNVGRHTNYGWISNKKCKEYSKWQPSRILMIGAENVPGLCGMSVQPAIVGGEKTGRLEFPHMAHLGIRKNSKITFDCGASLISKNFLLTAGHCIISTKPPNPEIAKFNLGGGNSQQTYKIAEIFVHPDYDFVSKYDDIALLKLDRNVKFDDTIRPACLQTKNHISNENAIATGWGATTWAGKSSENLLKVTLPIVNHSNCSLTYQRSKTRLKNGLDNKKMICAGGIGIEKDTCNGDSGGPLQIGNREICMYSIIGVTSFGNSCGVVPGVYTKVSNYIPWIESIVWPELGKG